MADGVALNVNIPAYVPPRPEGSRPRGGFGGGNAGDDPNAKRKERLDAIRDEFKKAIEYARVSEAASSGKAAPFTPDPRLEALAPFARGEKPVVFVAERRVEILDALKLASDLKLKAVISGGAEAWKVADELKAAKVPVLISGSLRIPLDRNDPYDAPYGNAAKLHAAGVVFAIRSIGQGPDQATSSRNLPFEAGFAVSHGLPEAEAIKSVTLNPATILGVGDTLGSLDVGKRANLVITEGPLLQVTSAVKGLFINGKPVSTANRQTKLHDKYAGRLAEIKAGRTPLGLVRNPAVPAIVPATGEGGSPAGASGDRR